MPKFESESLPEDEVSIPLLPFDVNGEQQAALRTESPPRGQRFKGRTPLPVLQLFILGLTRLAEPIAYTQIFPYVNQMIEDMKVTDQPAKVGYYSGLVDSVFAVCQLFTVFQWAKLSDRIGRKPVILIGITGVAISTALFGFSKTLWWAISSRSLAGILSGNAAVMDSVIGEITDETNQGAAFPLKAISWNLGCIIGPIIGGNLVKPEQSWPNSFGKYQILRQYPYLLPSGISACITLSAVICGILFLKESNPAHKRKLARSSGSARNPGIKYILSHKAVFRICRNHFALATLGTSFDVVFVLMAYTPVHLGGLARTPQEIGYALAFTGMVGTCIQVFLFPVLQRRYNNIPLYRAFMWLWPILFLLLPCLNFIARWTMPQELIDDENKYFPASPIVWICIMCLLIMLRTAGMSYSVNSILVKSAAPSPEMLGATFGLAQSTSCIARATAPTFVSTIFALSKKYQILDGHFVWLVMAVAGLLGVWSTYTLIDGSEESHQNKY